MLWSFDGAVLRLLAAFSPSVPEACPFAPAERHNAPGNTRQICIQKFQGLCVKVTQHVAFRRSGASCAQRVACQQTNKGAWQRIWCVGMQGYSLHGCTHRHRLIKRPGLVGVTLHHTKTAVIEYSRWRKIRRGSLYSAGLCLMHVSHARFENIFKTVTYRLGLCFRIN